ncbi:hypothetical protein [Streptomyces sp. NPDC006140]|uniref:hypothetical protein n=1 Tax=Streptomyces sp. NPDC006140 TaxID=3154579 RepID=UPI0033D9C28A
MQLWPISTVLILIFTVAIVTATVALYYGWDLPGGHSKNWFDLLKASFGLVAGAGALFALVIAYRRQRLDEETAMRDATRLHVERFSSAISLLGENSAGVPLSGVHTLAGLADDAPTSELRQTASTPCVRTCDCPTPPRSICQRTMRKPAVHIWPFGKSGTPSSGSSATTSA